MRFPPPPPSRPPSEPDLLLDGIPTPTGDEDATFWGKLGGESPGDTGAAPAAVDPGDFECAVALAEAPPKPGHGWVVSKSRSARKLHFVGMCFRIPGKHYLQFDVFGDVMPEEADIDSRCKDCFAALGAAGRAADSAEEASTASSSSSASSSDEGPPLKACKR